MQNPSLALAPLGFAGAAIPWWSLWPHRAKSARGLPIKIHKHWRD
jgi:hypothetical protein